MQILMSISKKIDAINEKIGLATSWALLLAVLVCVGNALARSFLNLGSNAYQELQWYLFGAVFLLSGAYTLKRNEHVRIDVITGNFSKRTQVIIDILGYLFFLFPMAGLTLYLGTPYAINAIRSQEISGNAGGLILWPARLLIPVCFLMLMAQGVSELIKRVAFLKGLLPANSFEKQNISVEDEIAAIREAGLAPHVPHATNTSSKSH